MPSDYYYLSIGQTLLYNKRSAVGDELAGNGANKIDGESVIRQGRSSAAAAVAVNGISAQLWRNNIGITRCRAFRFHHVMRRLRPDQTRSSDVTEKPCHTPISWKYRYS